MANETTSDNIQENPTPPPQQQQQEEGTLEQADQYDTTAAPTTITSTNDKEVRSPLLAIDETKDDEEFVNQGLRLWEQSRTRWLGHQLHRKSLHDDNNSAQDNNSPCNNGHPMGTSDGTDSTARPAAVPIEVDEIIEVVFAIPRQMGNSSASNTSGDETSGADDGPPKFRRTVPLPQMVDILVDLWEAEGLDI